MKEEVVKIKIFMYRPQVRKNSTGNFLFEYKENKLKIKNQTISRYMRSSCKMELNCISIIF